MGDVLKFSRHGRASAGTRRAAKVAKVSAVSPASRALEVSRIGIHHSGGIESRCGHLRAATTDAPMSAASLSGEPQSETISRKVDTMPDILGPSVPKVKAVLSHDADYIPRQHAAMGDDAEKLPDSEWRAQFRARIRQIQGDRTDQQMATIMGIERSTWTKYIGKRESQPDIRLLPKIAALGSISVEELINGPKAAPAAKPKGPQKKRA